MAKKLYLQSVQISLRGKHSVWQRCNEVLRQIPAEKILKAPSQTKTHSHPLLTRMNLGFWETAHLPLH